MTVSRLGDTSIYGTYHKVKATNMPELREPVLESVAEDLKVITEQIEKAKSMAGVAKEAGEDVSKLMRDIGTLEVRKNKWQRVLESRGYSTK